MRESRIGQHGDARHDHSSVGAVETHEQHHSILEPACSWLTNGGLEIYAESSRTIVGDSTIYQMANGKTSFEIKVLWMILLFSRMTMNYLTNYQNIESGALAWPNQEVPHSTTQLLAIWMFRLALKLVIMGFLKSQGQMASLPTLSPLSKKPMTAISVRELPGGTRPHDCDHLIRSLTLISGLNL